VAELDVAVITAVPLPFEVTTPASETVAINSSDELQVTVGLAMVLSLASFHTSVIVAVSANDANERLVGESVTDTLT
jgi:hypothetical protein